MKRAWQTAWVWLCVAATVLWVNTAWAQTATDKSIGDLAEEARSDLLGATGFISAIFYIIGAILVGFGMLKIKRHSDQPQQVTLGSGIMWILIGVALIVAPFIIDAVANTFGTDAGGSGPNIAPPKLN